MIGAIENAMLAQIALASSSGAIPYAYRTMASWPKLFDEYQQSETVQYPACWAAFGGSHTIQRVGTGRFRCHSYFTLVVAAENARNDVARRQGGSPLEVGSYQMAEDAMRILGNQKLGLDIDSLDPQSILPVETADVPKLRQVSMYGIAFATAFTLDLTLNPAANLTDFTTFHANWDPAPYGHVNSALPLPQDAAAVATDIITLPQD